MKTSHRFAIAGALLACSGAAAAASGSLNEFQPHMMPVLVQVNSQGQVTSASPPVELPPNVNRLLRTNLDEMIKKPATDKNGRPMSSQFVINLAVQATPMADGKFDTRFAYVSTAPVPAGSWYWVHINGHRLALARQGSGERTRLFRDYDREPVFRSYDQNQPTAPNANAAQGAAMPAPAPDPGHRS